MSQFTRRDFLKASLVAGLSQGVLRAGPLDEATPVPEAPGSGAWFKRPMRFANLTLVEEDARDFDPKFWLDYFARIHADCATLSAGGYLAYYPTQIPLHRRAAGAGASDPFGSLCHGARRLGMNVIARVDPHACREELRVAHPDWISTDANGAPRRHLAIPELWITCALGPYNFEFMRSVIHEIVSSYPVDAVFSNRWNGIGWCYCANCRGNFHAASGLDIPRTESPDDPAHRPFVAWQQQRLFELWALWDRTVRSVNPAGRFIPNMGGGIWQFLDMREIGRRADILFADRQGRTAGATGGTGLTAPWAIGRAGKEFRAVMGGKTVGAGYSVGVEEPYRWKDSVQSEAEQRVWMADGIANGLRLSFGKTGARVLDDRWMGFTADLFNWHYRHERYLRDRTPLARVALVYAQRSKTSYGHGPVAGADSSQRHYHNFVDYPYRSEDHASGMYQALIEARIPFEMVSDRLLDPDHLDRFKLLILPNISVLDDAQCEQLRAFVRRGGSLVATYETSLYDADGQRKDFGLADLFGARFDGWRSGPVLNSYVALNRAAPHAGSLLHGFGRAARIVGGVWYLDVGNAAGPGPGRESPLTLIPAFPHLPMEEVYARQPHTDISEVFLRTVGEGRIAYFPWDIDRLFWEALIEDHGHLLANAITWALDEPPVVSVTGPGVLDVVPWRQEDSITVHLVNLTNPFMMKGPFRELVEAGAQRVRLTLPAGRKVRRVRLLVADCEPAFFARDEVLELTVPSIRDHEVIAVDLA